MPILSALNIAFACGAFNCDFLKIPSFEKSAPFVHKYNTLSAAIKQHKTKRVIMVQSYDGQYAAMVRVQSYDESADLFTLAAVGFTPEDEIEFPVYSRAAPDFDDFEVPGIVLPSLIGECGEPSELVGRAFVVAL